MEAILLSRTWLVSIACVLLVACHQRSVEFRQVHVGGNGPKTFQMNYIEDRLSLDKSWIKSTLSDTEFSALRSQIDFDSQLLVAIALGERKSASGSVKINSVYLYTGVATLPLNINVQVGVIGDVCQHRDRVSAPFTLLILKKPEKFQLPGGFDIANFDDGCPSNQAADRFR